MAVPLLATRLWISYLPSLWFFPECKVRVYSFCTYFLRVSRMPSSAQALGLQQGSRHTRSLISWG